MTGSEPRNMPPEVAEIAECGFAIWGKDDVDEKLRSRFDPERSGGAITWTLLLCAGHARLLAGALRERTEF